MEKSNGWLLTIKDKSNVGVPYQIAVDSSGNVFIHGKYGPVIDGETKTFILVKYDSSGNEKWTRTEMDGDGPVAFNFHKNGIYLGSLLYTIEKYDTNGNRKWKADNDTSDAINPADFALDSHQNIYVSSEIDTSNSTSFLLAKYNKEGLLKWKRVYGKEQFYHYSGPGVITDSDDNIYVYGQVHADLVKDDQFVTIKYDSLGNRLWVKKYDGPQNTYCDATNLAIDHLNNVYVIGWVADYDTNDEDFALVCYNSNGDLLYDDIYGIASRNEEGNYISIDQDNNVFITGVSSSDQNVWTITLKYSPLPVSLSKSKPIIPNKPVLYPNFPNPFNSTTAIDFYLPSNMVIRIMVYDILGKEIKTLYKGKKQVGRHKLVFNAENIPSGIYVCSIVSKGFIMNRKILLIK